MTDKDTTSQNDDTTVTLEGITISDPTNTTCYRPRQP